MTAQRRLTRREELEPLSVRGRAAGITAGACLALAGLGLMPSAWAALTCPLGGEQGRTLCSRTVGIGGLTELFAIGLLLGGCAILWRTARRPIDPDGLSGWTWGEGIAIVASGLTIALLIPTFHCPPGYELTPVFHACHSTTMTPELILHPPTWLGWKFGVTAGAVALGLIVGRWRRLPWPVASVLTVAWVGAATWYLADTTGGLPTFR
jgi:hypothetical protein